MRILAVETSCDETALSLIEASGSLSRPKFKILKHLVASQIKIHRPFGGVVPNLAKREHIKNLPILYGKIAGISPSVRSGSRARSRDSFEFPISNQFSISQSQKPKDFFAKVDLIAVTVGPGLEPALWTGIEFAKKLYSKFKIQNSKLKLAGVNHLEGHLYSFLLPQRGFRLQVSSIKDFFPAISLIVSGGHTILLLMKDLKTIKKLGETRDDAAGEAFDKVARLLNLSYPGGPELEKLAKRGDPRAINFPRPMLDQKNYDFSFSGLKTAVLYYLRDNKNIKKEDVAASFQAAALGVLIKKTLRATEEYRAKAIIVSGGVAANRELRKQLKKEIRKLKKPRKPRLLISDFRFCTDNASIIGAAGYINLLRKKSSKLVAQGNLNFDS